MKTFIAFIYLAGIYILIGLFTNCFAQIEIDSTSASYDGNSVYTLKGYASFQANPKYEDGKYAGGFLFGTERIPFRFYPAGAFVWVNNKKQLHWETQIVNLQSGRYFYQAFISPNTIPIGFNTTDEVGSLTNNYDAPFITSDLRPVVNVPDSSIVTFHIDAEGTELNYEWTLDIPDVDTTFAIDTLGNQIDSVFTLKYIYDGIYEVIAGEITNTLSFTVSLSNHQSKFRSKIYNVLGEVFSRISLLKIR